MGGAGEVADDGSQGKSRSLLLLQVLGKRWECLRPIQPFRIPDETILKRDPTSMQRLTMNLGCWLVGIHPRLSGLQQVSEVAGPCACCRRTLIEMDPALSFSDAPVCGPRKLRQLCQITVPDSPGDCSACPDDVAPDLKQLVAQHV